MKGGLGPASQYLESQNLVQTRSRQKEVVKQPEILKQPDTIGRVSKFPQDRVVVEIPRRVKFAPITKVVPEKELPEIEAEKDSEVETDKEEDKLDELKETLNQPKLEP